MRNSYKAKASALAKKISYEFPNSPEGMLMFSIVKQAIFDSVNYSEPSCDRFSTIAHDRFSAIAYLKGDIIHCELAGVDAGYVKRLINKMGMPYSV